jgi:diaminopimelate decarboxylase
MSISPSLWSEYHSVIAVDSANSAEEIDYTVIGNMPSQLDVIAPRMTLPKLAPGDVLAVMDTGAYFTSFGNTFAGPRPPIVMIESSGDRLIRRRESYEELFSRDVEMKAPTDSAANRSGH